MLYAETQIVSHLWKEVASTDGRSQREAITLETSRRMCPAEETAQAVLNWHVVGEIKSRFVVASPAGSGARAVGHPEVDEVAGELRIRFLQGFQFSSIDKALQTTQVL